MNRLQRLVFLVLVTLAVMPWTAAAQNAVTLLWDQGSPTSVTGYRVALDGVWHDYGTALVAADGGCVCSLALSLATGSHTFVVAAYNADAETASATMTYTAGTPTTPAVPGAPASPSPAAGATAASTSPTLTWTAGGATTFDVSLGTTNPPPAVASALTTASYQGTLTASTPYFWRIVAHNSTGTTSGPVWSFTTPSATTTGALPAPWTSQDIGDVGVAGSTTFSNGAFTVAGGGLDIWGTADAFQYLSQPLTGNAQIVARVNSLQDTNGNAKAGVMLRGSLSASSPHVMLDSAVDGSIELITRSGTGSAATFVMGAMQTRPIWLKLAQTGTTVVASVSYRWPNLVGSRIDHRRDIRLRRSRGHERRSVSAERVHVRQRAGLECNGPAREKDRSKIAAARTSRQSPFVTRRRLLRCRGLRSTCLTAPHIPPSVRATGQRYTPARIAPCAYFGSFAAS